MPYSLLIKISHTTISFSANKDGEGVFTPYGEPLRPLAVWFTGSSVTIGADAKQQAQCGTSNAFYHIFDRMKEPGKHFEFANETHDYNKLLLYTIRAGVEEFLVKEMMNSLGQLEDNIGHLPVLVIFDMDVTANEKSVVMGQLQRNGFGNVKLIDDDDYLMRSKNIKGNVLMLSSDGTTLYGVFYKDNLRVGDFSAEGLGRDPRVEKLARLIWERTGAANDWLVYKNEEDYLEDAANKFLISGRSECDEDVILSNNKPYHYYLQQSDFWVLSKNDELGVSRVIMDRLQTWQCNRQTCTVFLKNQAVRNKYIIEQLGKEFPQRFFVVEKTMKERCHALMLEDCRKANFAFQQQTGSTANIQSLSNPQPQDMNQEAIVEHNEPTPRDKRDFRILKSEFAACQANGYRQEAVQKCESFLEHMHTKGITAFDDDVAALQKDVGKSVDAAKGVKNQDDTKRKSAVAAKPEEKETNDEKNSNKASCGVEPIKRDHNFFKLLEQDLKVCAERHDKSTAKTKADAFLAEMHRKGVVAFDNDVALLLSQIKSAVEPTPRDKRDMRVLESTIETLKAKKDKIAIQRECKNFLDIMHKKGVVAFDEEISVLLRQLK